MLSANDATQESSRRRREPKLLPAPFIVARWHEKNNEIEYNFHTLVPN